MGEKWQAKICPQCKVNEMEKGHRICKPCRQSNAKTRTKENNKLAKAERAAARKQLKCKCGCGLPVIYPSRYATDDCREKARKEVCKRYREGQQEQAEVDLAPVVQKPTLTDEQQAEINRASAQRDTANHALFMQRTLGLVVQEGKALASPVRHLSPQEIAALSQVYQPPVKSYSTFVAPYIYND